MGISKRSLELALSSLQFYYNSELESDPDDEDADAAEAEDADYKKAIEEVKAALSREGDECT